MSVVLIANSKGGVGKTTTAVNLGHAFALANRKTLLLDLDAQGHVSVALGLKREPQVYDLLVHGKAQIRRTGRDGLYILPGDEQTAIAAQIIAGRPYSHTTLVKALRPISPYFDCIVVDTPPGISVLTIAAIMAATDVLIPVSCEELALDGLVEYTHSLKDARDNGATCRLRWVVPTMYDRVSKEIARNFRGIAQAFPQRVTVPVPRDARMREAPAYHQTIWEYAPKCRSALAYGKLAQRIINDLEETHG